MELIAHHIDQTVEERIAWIDVMSTTVGCRRTLILQELLLVEEEIELCQVFGIDIVPFLESLADNIRNRVNLIDAVREFTILTTQILEGSFKEQPDIDGLQATLVTIFL